MSCHVRSEKGSKEAYRVLKPGGLLLFADSLQKDDDEELNWALERFPKSYHEPFYTDYIKDKMENLVKRSLKEVVFSLKAFLTKAVWIHKTSASREI